MPIYQRGKNKTWWLDYTDANGKRVRESAGTESKQEAQELLDKMKAQMWQAKRLGIVEKPAHIWEEAVVRWLKEQGHKRSISDDKKNLLWLHQHLSGVALSDITKAKIDQIKQAKLASGVKNSTVNRVLALIRSILNRAKDDWEWLESVPKIRLLPEPLQRVRWLTHDEAAKLLHELPEHLEAMARFTLATGLRESNVTGLKWSQIDMQRRCAWIYADEAKGKRDISVPLNADALAVIRAQIGKHKVHVFTYEGEPVTRANNHAWRKALKRAGLDGFKWHGLRHTWASWHIQNGTSIAELKELGGWADLKMVTRYAHLSSGHLSSVAENVMAQIRHK